MFIEVKRKKCSVKFPILVIFVSPELRLSSLTGKKNSMSYTFFDKTE